MIDLILPIRTISESNQREHWASRYRRRKQQRESARLGMRQVPRPDWDVMTVRLGRIAPRRMDSDNLAGALKAVRDGICDWLRIDDGDSRLAFVYHQTRGGPKEYAVRVQIVDWQLGDPWPGDE